MDIEYQEYSRGKRHTSKDFYIIFEIFLMFSNKKKMICKSLYDIACHRERDYECQDLSITLKLYFCCFITLLPVLLPVLRFYSFPKINKFYFICSTGQCLLILVTLVLISSKVIKQTLTCQKHLSTNNGVTHNWVRGTPHPVGFFGKTPICQ